MLIVLRWLFALWSSAAAACCFLLLPAAACCCLLPAAAWYLLPAAIELLNAPLAAERRGVLVPLYRHCVYVRQPWCFRRRGRGCYVRERAHGTRRSRPHTTPLSSEGYKTIIPHPRPPSLHPNWHTHSSSRRYTGGDGDDDDDDDDNDDDESVG